MQSASTILDTNIIVDLNEENDIQVPEQLIKEYQDLNTKLDQALLKIHKRRKNPHKK